MDTQLCGVIRTVAANIKRSLERYAGVMDLECERFEDRGEDDGKWFTGPPVFPGVVSMYRSIAIAAAVMTNTVYDRGAMWIVKSLPRPRDHVQSQTIPYRDYFRGNFGGNFDLIRGLELHSGPGYGKGDLALMKEKEDFLTL